MRHLAEPQPFRAPNARLWLRPGTPARAGGFLQGLLRPRPVFPRSERAEQFSGRDNQAVVSDKILLFRNET